MNTAQFFRTLQVDANPDLGAVLLNAPSSDDELTCWHRDHLPFTLPNDLVALFKLHNGVRNNAEGGICHLAAVLHDTCVRDYDRKTENRALS